MKAEDTAVVELPGKSIERDPPFGSAVIPKRQAPWWVYIVAACYLMAFAFGVYVSYMGYGRLGAAMSDAPKGGVLVDQVVPGLPLERAGVHAGDIVVAVDGQTVRSDHDFGELMWQFEPQKPFCFSIERGGEHLERNMVLPPRRVWQTLNQERWLEYLFSHALATVYVAVGLLVLFRRPRDSGAVAGAFVLLAFGNFFALMPTTGIAVLFRRLPSVLQVPVIMGIAMIGSYLLLVFAALFPRPVFRRRWLLAALIVPGLLLVANNLLRHIHRFYMPWQAVSPGPPWIFKLQLAIEIAYLVAALIVFGVAYSRLKDAYERQHLRTVFYGALGSFSALVVFFWLLSMTSSPTLLKVLAFPPTRFLFLILWSAFPLAFGYTVLRDGRRAEPQIGLPSVV